MIGLLRVYVRVYSCSVGRQWKRWIETMKDCLRKRGLDVKKARRMVQGSSEWCGVCEGECIGCNQGDEPLPLMRWNSCGLSQLYKDLQ